MTQNFGIKDFFYESIGPQMEKVFNVSFDDLKDEKFDPERLKLMFISNIPFFIDIFRNNNVPSQKKMLYDEIFSKFGKFRNRVARDVHLGNESKDSRAKVNYALVNIASWIYLMILSDNEDIGKACKELKNSLVELKRLDEGKVNDFIANFVIKIKNIAHVENYVRQTFEVSGIDKDVIKKFISKCEEEKIKEMKELFKEKEPKDDLLNKKRTMQRFSFDKSEESTIDTSKISVRTRKIDDYFKKEKKEKNYRNIKKRIKEMTIKSTTNDFSSLKNTDISLDEDKDIRKPLISNDTMLTYGETLPSSAASSKFPLSFNSVNKHSTYSLLSATNTSIDYSYPSHSNSQTATTFQSPSSYSFRGINSKFIPFENLPKIRSTSKKKKNNHKSFTEKFMNTIQSKIGDDLIKSSLRNEDKTNENRSHNKAIEISSDNFYGNNSIEVDEEKKEKSKNKKEKKKPYNDILAYKTPEKKDPFMKFKDIPVSEDETKKNFMRVLFNNFHKK